MSSLTPEAYARRRDAYEPLRKVGRPSDGVRWCCRRRLCRLRACGQAGELVGDFNLWDGRRHAMRVRGNGFWEIFVPEARAGDKYKYEIVGPDGHLLPLKSDPLAFAAELRPQTASIVVDRDTIPQPQPAPAGIKLVLLKAIAPRVSRVTAIFNPAMARRGGAYYLASIEAARGRGKSLARFTSSRAFEAFYGCPWKLHADFDRGGGCRPPIVLVSARRRSNIRAVWHLDEFEVPNVRAAPRVHRFPADFTVRQTVILGHGFVVPNFVYCPAVGAFKSFCHLKNILWLGVGFQTGFDGEVAIAVAQVYLARM